MLKFNAPPIGRPPTQDYLTLLNKIFETGSNSGNERVELWRL